MSTISQRKRTTPNAELLHPLVSQVFELIVSVFFATLGLVLGGDTMGLAFNFQAGEVLLQAGQDFAFLAGGIIGAVCEVHSHNQGHLDGINAVISGRSC